MIASTPPPAYVVQAGDSLWSISARELGSGDDWPKVYNLNRGTIHDPNLIYPGQVLRLTGWRRYGHLGEARGHSYRADPDPVTVSAPGRYSGTLGCAALEGLWESAGGPAWAAFTAAEVAMAESGGRQYATGPAGERGYWQINPDHGSLSTYDPWGNARAAVLISSYGRDWSAWTTYTHGLYLGRCLPSAPGPGPPAAGLLRPPGRPGRLCTSR